MHIHTGSHLTRESLDVMSSLPGSVGRKDSPVIFLPRECCPRLFFTSAPWRREGAGGRGTLATAERSQAKTAVHTAAGIQSGDGMSAIQRRYAAVHPPSCASYSRLLPSML